MDGVADYLDVPKTAAENAPVDITFCDVTYQFSEPPKRRTYTLLGRGLQILGHSESAKLMDEQGGIDLLSRNMIAMGATMEQTPEMLEFVYDAFRMDKKVRKQVENDFVFAELLATFQAIIEVLQRPFVGGRTNTGPANLTPPPSTDGACATNSCNDGASLGPK